MISDKKNLFDEHNIYNRFFTVVQSTFNCAFASFWSENSYILSFGTVLISRDSSETCCSVYSDILGFFAVLQLINEIFMNG